MKKRKMHPITKVVTWTLVATFILSGCCLDSESMVFVASGFASLFGLVAIAWVHGFFS